MTSRAWKSRSPSADGLRSKNLFHKNSSGWSFQLRLIWWKMIRRLEFRFVIAALLALARTSRVEAQANGLKLLLTLESPSITYPFPARATLHLVNGGTKPVWLYHRARASDGGAGPAVAGPALSDSPPNDGPSLAVRFETAAKGDSERGEGAILDPTGIAHPKLVRLGPGEEYTEKEVIRLSPANAGEETKRAPVWGRYRLSATYRAAYSNAGEVTRMTGVELWQGEITSAPAEIELAAPTATGSLSGSVLGSDNQRITDALVSLTDGEEQLIGQTEPDSNGQFTFSSFPTGVYWVVVERWPRKEETAVFRRFDLTAESPETSYNFILAPPEIYEPKQILHEPVLFRVTNPAGDALANVEMEITWSSGEVMDSVKTRTDPEGLATVELIPGANFVSLKQKKCPEEDQRVGVEGRGVVEAFNLVEECRKP
jgi:carboxypeptidase family protein